MDHRFGSGSPFSLGVEEELFVVEPGDGRMVNRGPEVLERLDPPAAGTVAGEVRACQVELITGVCETVGQAIGGLEALGRAVLDTGVGLLGSGTHPSAEEGDAEVNDKDRYRLISALLGDAAATPVSALHVHVGMPDPETAIRVFNGLRGHLPLLEALGANAPFRHGRDTGLASARELTLRGWPRSDAPRAFSDFEDFVSSTQTLTAVAEVPDYTFHWWKMRPHPRLGTVEVRALDVQARPEHTAGLVALVHCLARHAAEADPVPGPSPEVLDEASSKAGRLGVAASLPDAALSLRPVAELLADAMDLARPRARELDCTEELEGLTALLELGGGAGLQHAAFEQGGMAGLLDTLTRRTA
jgi:carboxylate-amine ligase